MSIRINGVDRNSTLHELSEVNHGTYHLADNPNLYEIQRSNNFEFEVPNINGILRAGMLGNESNATIDNAEEVIRISVTQCPIPHFTQNVIEVRRGNNVIKYAGTPTFGAGQLVLNDYIGADTKSALMAWQNLSYDVRTEKVGIQSDYKKECYLVEYSPDYQEVRRWRLTGCWVSGISEDSYNSEDDGKKSITATIEYDKATIDTSSLI